ncbi:phage major tail tube protein [Roseobacteraceae bacterium NS-SX3]
MSRHGQITNAHIYNDERDLWGISAEFQIPSVETQMIEHETLGAVGVLKLPARGLRALDCTFKLQYPDVELHRQMLRPNKTVSLHLHETVDLFDIGGLNEDASTTLVTSVRCYFSKVDSGGSKLGEARDLTGEASAVYFMQRVTNSETPLIEVNLMENIYRVNGEPVWPE